MRTFFPAPSNFFAALLTLIFSCPAAFSQTEPTQEAPAHGLSSNENQLTAITGLAGICAVIRQDKETKKVLIVQVLPDGAAEKAGLRVKDFLVKVDGKSTEGMGAMDVASLLRGIPGTKVIVTVARESFPAPKDFVVIREMVKLKEVPSH